MKEKIPFQVRLVNVRLEGAVLSLNRNYLQTEMERIQRDGGGFHELLSSADSAHFK